MVDEKYCVYCHVSPSGKRYVGITKDKPTRRWNNGKGYVKNKHFYNAINKYGWENIEHEILMEGLSQQEACEKEVEFIHHFRSNERDYGYNLSSGGESGYAGCSWSKTRKEVFRQKMLGNSFCKGYKHSEETRRNMSVAQLHRNRIPLTEVQIRQCIANLPHPQKGADNPMARPVLCIESGVIYSCGKEAAEDLGLQQSHISNVCRGRRRTTGGYHFKYYEEREVFGT